jgi:hypothetical protein
MPTHSSFTADASSKLSDRVAKVLRKAVQGLPEERAERIKSIQERIRDLDSRGFLKREQFKSLTTGEFERRFASMKTKVSD